MVTIAEHPRPLELETAFELHRGGSPADVWAPIAPADVTPDEAAVREHARGGSGQVPSSGTHQPALPWAARVYVGAVILSGVGLVTTFYPTAVSDPALSAGLLTLVLVCSVFKVELPVLGTSATMSASFIANFMTLMLVGPEQAMLFAGAGGWFQCVVHKQPRRTQAYRILFSIATLVITVQATSLVYSLLGGRPGTLDLQDLVTPIVGAAFTYFLCNAVLVALAAALATRQPFWRVWNDAFLSSGTSFFVGTGVAVAASWFIQQGQALSALMFAVPAYLTYFTYRQYLGRIDDERRHAADVAALHGKAMHALDLVRRSERALAIEKERLSVTLGSIGEAVLAADTRGRVVLLNHTAEVFTGWPQEQAVGMPAADVFRLVDRETGRPYANPVDKVLRALSSVERDNHAAIVSRDGSQRLVEHSATPVKDEDGNVVAVVLVARDMTDAMRLEAERTRAGKLASLGVLAGGIAHDFNNILTAIVGNISLAQLDERTASQRSNLAEAEKACLRAKGLTHQLLTFAKGGSPLKKLIFLQDIIREAAGFAVRGSNVRCEFNLTDDLWAVDADENQLVQVVNNLVLNAVQAMPDGGFVDVSADNVPCLPDTEEGRSRVRIQVRDHGVGIPEALLGKIFDPYFTTKALGSGLGLATVYSIVANHGGEITVESRQGHGTTMTILLPAVPDVTRPGRADDHTGLVRGKGRVLVMDDEEAVRDVARAMLSRLGFRVEVVADGKAAIATYVQALDAGDRFDAVVMDLTVPGGMGGREAIKALRSVDANVRAIVSSGYADDPVMSEYELYGFSGVVPKPFTIADLGRQMQRAMQPQQ
jgi:PAS domain S-box-containing protein